MKRSPLKRGKPLARGTKRLPAKSARRVEEQAERDECRRIVLARAGHRCEYEGAIPEVRCGFLPGRRQLEVDELRGGAYRSTEYLDPERCRAACPKHHDFKTEHKRVVLARLEAWEEEHGWAP